MGYRGLFFSSDSGRDLPRGAIQTQRFSIVKGIIDHGATDVGSSVNMSSVATKASNCNGGHRGVQDRHAGLCLSAE